VATLFEVQSGSTFVSAKTARLGSEESSVPKPCRWRMRRRRRIIGIEIRAEPAPRVWWRKACSR